MPKGLRIATEAREAGVLPQWLFLADDGAAHPLAKALVDATLAAGGEVIDTTPAILSKLSGKDNAQTIVGIYAEPKTVLTDLDRDAAPIWLVAERLRDPGNLGTMLRTGDAVGAGGLILLGESSPTLFGRGGARVHGGDLHPAFGAGRVGRIPRLAARRAGRAGRDLAGRRHTGLSGSALHSADLHPHRPNESQGMPADYAAAPMCA